jgi:hypothetical protein
LEILSQYCSRLFQDLVTCVTDHSQNVLGLACLSSHIQRSVHIPMAGKNFGFIEARKWLLQRFTNVSTSSCVFSTSTTSCEYDSNRISNDLPLHQICPNGSLYSPENPVRVFRTILILLCLRQSFAHTSSLYDQVNSLLLIVRIDCTFQRGFLS